LPREIDAAELFNTAFRRTLDGYRIVTSLILYAMHGAPSAAAGLSESAVPLMEEIVAVERRPDAIAAVTQATMADAHSAVQAASIVFMHSSLDAAALDYCRVTAAVRPLAWEKYVLEEKFPLRRILRNSTAELVGEEVAAFMKRLSNRSLPQKIAALHDVCKPGSAQILPSYRFDSARIKHFDERRHDIVHGDGLGSLLSVVDIVEEVEYLRLTNVYLSALVTNAYGLKLDRRAFSVGQSSIGNFK